MLGCWEQRQKIALVVKLEVTSYEWPSPSKQSTIGQASSSVPQPLVNRLLFRTSKDFGTMTEYFLKYQHVWTRLHSKSRQVFRGRVKAWKESLMSRLQVLTVYVVFDWTWCCVGNLDQD